MSDAGVWLPNELKPLVDELRAKTGGFLPIVNFAKGSGPSSLHLPTLYPQLSIPDEPNGDWGNAAYGLCHLIRSLDGVPELRGFGQEINSRIACEIHSELEAITNAKAKIHPKPHPIANLKMVVEQYLAQDHNDLPHRIFQGIKLFRFRMEENPEADAAIELLRNSFPKEAETAERTFDVLLDCDLNSPFGKAKAAKEFLSALQIDTSAYFFHRYSFNPGTTDIRSLDYFDGLESAERTFALAVPSPYTWLKLQLPFAIPSLEGVYLLDDAAVLLTHIRVTNPRSTWQGGSGVRVEEMMDPVGLYMQSEIQLRLSGQFNLEATPPSSEAIYKNLRRYPEIVHQGVSVLNRLIVALRITSGRCDIPDVVPAHFNRIAVKQTNANGDVTRDIPSFSLECLRLTTGVPKVETEICRDICHIEAVPFWRQLLEAAKLHAIQFNARRAVLDFSGAFEAFVAAFLKPKVGDLSEDIKGRFLTIYKGRLPDVCREVIEKLTVDAGQDSKQPPSVRKIVRRYNVIGAGPPIDKNKLSLVLKVYKYRNDAAHGRPISSSALDDVVLAIEALEQIHLGMSLPTS